MSGYIIIHQRRVYFLPAELVRVSSRHMMAYVIRCSPFNNIESNMLNTVNLFRLLIPYNRNCSLCFWLRAYFQLVLNRNQFCVGIYDQGKSGAPDFRSPGRCSAEKLHPRWPSSLRHRAASRESGDRRARALRRSGTRQRHSCT